MFKQITAFVIIFSLLFSILNISYAVNISNNKYISIYSEKLGNTINFISTDKINKVLKNIDKKKKEIIISKKISILKKNSYLSQLEAFSYLLEKSILDRNTFKIANDIFILKNILDNNYKNFSSEESEFSDYLRSFIFSENNSKTAVTKNLKECIDTSNYSLVSWEELLICKWINKYDEKIDTNYYHIKDFFNTISLINKWENINCNYFLSWKYDYPEDRKLKQELEDYLICNYTKDKSYSIIDNNFYYHTALNNKKCNFLKDKNLYSICEKEKLLNTK